MVRSSEGLSYPLPYGTGQRPEPSSREMVRAAVRTASTTVSGGGQSAVGSTTPTAPPAPPGVL
ncbi:hypothetical protein [Nocardia otitidiscaviarum]|uniref:hypothetical protein n=1 Tax=Nocardia otitidiscaviarum TaxID=1823 RepID=UPI0024549A80|nr:hypothetical protein [Nocardia otitidiscaviarum]